MNGNQIIGLWAMKGAAIAGILIVAWRMQWLHQAAAGIRGWLWELGFWPEHPADDWEEYDDLDENYYDDDLTVAEAVAAVPELDLDGTQPFAAVYHDGKPADAMPTVVLGDGSYAGLSGTIPTDVPRRGVKPPDQRPEGVLSTDAGPGYLPFQPHAGPPAWRPRHAKTSWLDELITDCLGAPSVEVYMWNWQQQYRLAVTA